MNLNKAFLIGRLTADPQTKNLPSGTQVCNFGLATDRYFTDKSGQKQKQTDFHNIVAFGKLAETISQYLTKGGLVFIEGRIRTRSWEDASGQKRYRTEIIAERIQLGPKSAGKEIPPEPVPEPEVKEEIPIVEENEEINVKDIPL